MKNYYLIGIALAAAAGPAFAVSAPTLQTGPSTTQTTVTATVAPACAISGGISTITVDVGLNGGVVTGSGNNEGGIVTVTCNTPSGVVSIGSDDMKNTTGQPIVETALFTDTIQFAGGVRAPGDTASAGWRLASRATNSWGAWQSAYISANTPNLRVLELGISAIDFETLSKIPTAGSYVGKVCVTVNPSGVPLNAPGTATCTAAS
jgi:hypothetical protein